MHTLNLPFRFVFPPLEDANAIQVGIMEVMRALLEKRIERADAGTLLYALQIAQSNLRNISLVGKPLPEGIDEDELSMAAILMKEIRLAEEEGQEIEKRERETKEKTSTLTVDGIGVPR